RGAAAPPRQRLPWNPAVDRAVGPGGVQPPQKTAIAAADFANRCRDAAAPRERGTLLLEGDRVLGVVSDRDERRSLQLQVYAQRVSGSFKHARLEDVVLRRRRAGYRQRADQLRNGDAGNAHRSRPLVDDAVGTS